MRRSGRESNQNAPQRPKGDPDLFGFWKEKKIVIINGGGEGGRFVIGWEEKMTGSAPCRSLGIEIGLFLSVSARKIFLE